MADDEILAELEKTLGGPCAGSALAALRTLDTLDADDELWSQSGPIEVAALAFGRALQGWNAEAIATTRAVALATVERAGRRRLDG